MTSLPVNVCVRKVSRISTVIALAFPRDFMAFKIIRAITILATKAFVNSITWESPFAIVRIPCMTENIATITFALDTV